MQKVFVAMSGGVDSSVAAALLKERGFDVVGVHMRCFNVDGCAERDAEDARRVASVLQIPFYVWDFEKEYKERVVQYMIDGYKAGITPNPDVMCNREIKFGLFLARALAMGADFVATGHYARRREIKNQKSKIKNFVLATARDLNKDQTYFLWTLTQNQLKHCLFPIGDYLKPQVRQMARKFGLPTAEKKDSQGICFLGQVTLADFLKEYIPARPGLVLNTRGQKVGEHEGAALYTIGQRHIGVANRPASPKRVEAGGFTRTGRGSTRKDEMKPLYVAGKNISTNTLTVAEGDEDPALYRKEITLVNVNFINPQHSNILQNVGMSVYARVRYRQPLARATLQLINSRPQAVTHQLKFDQPIKFVAAGQSAVFYRATRSTSSGSKSNDFEMLGGGIIV